MSLTVVTNQDGIGVEKGGISMTLACKNGVHWLSPDAKKKNASMTNVAVCVFSPPSFCRYRVIRYWFSLPIINIVVAVGLTTIWFETASIVKKIKKKHIRFRLIFIERWHYHLQITISAGMVFVNYFLDGGCGCNILYRHPMGLKGGFIVIITFCTQYFFLFSKSGSRVHRLYYIYIYMSGMWCGLQGRPQTFWPHAHVHRR